jgi:histidinol-phosphate aminotransferase
MNEDRPRGPAPIPRPGVLQITTYAGGDQLLPGVVRRVSLASNENPYGPSPHVWTAIQASAAEIHRYPSGPASPLRFALAAHFRLNEAQIICSNGSEEIIHLLVSAYAGPDDEVIYPQYGFLVYRIATLSAGATPVLVPQPNLRLDVEAVLEAVTPRTKIILIDNPANPLGSYVTRSEIDSLRERLPNHILLVLDGAYADFMDDVADYTAGLAWVQDSDNIVVTRTFSKAYGLAGLRVGWAYMPLAIATAVNAIRLPFNVNRFAQTAAIAALQDQAWVRQVCQRTVAQRLNVERALRDLGFKLHPCYTNFLLLELATVEEARAVMLFLGQEGIIVRPLEGYTLPTFLRITLGTPVENQALIDRLTQLKQL